MAYSPAGNRAQICQRQHEPRRHPELDLQARADGSDITVSEPSVLVRPLFFDSLQLQMVGCSPPGRVSCQSYPGMAHIGQGKEDAIQMKATAEPKVAQEITLRQMVPTDSAAINLLNRQTPDTGAVGFYSEFHHDMYETLLALRPNVAGVVAQVANYDGLAGMGLVSFAECIFEGELRPYAYLNSLGVHKDYRRRGIASRLALWRVELARERFAELGRDGVIFAGVQAGNTGSLLAAAKWSNQTLEGRSQVGIAKMLEKPPKRTARLSVRPAEPGDLEQIVERQNGFFRDYNLYTPQTAESLADWRSKLVFGEPLHKYYVAVDRKGNILAGCGVTGYGRLITDHVVRMPRPLRIANMFLRIVPSDGVSKRLSVDQFWYSRGKAQAGNFLWNALRWLLRDRGNIMMTFFDPRGPQRQVITIPRFVPKTTGSIVLHARVPASVDRLMYFQT